MTISTDLIAAYRAQRAKQMKDVGRQYFSRGASDALSYARAALALAKARAVLPFDLPRYAGETEETEETDLPGGLLIRIVIENDDDATPYVFEDNRIDWCGRYEDSDIFTNAPSGWLSHDGRRIYGRSERGDRYIATPGECSGYTFAQYYADKRAQGMAKQPAREWARKMAQRDADTLRQALDERYGVTCCAYTVTLMDSDRHELDSEACGGFDDLAYCISDAEAVARAMIARYIKEHADDADGLRKAKKPLRLERAQLAAECEALPPMMQGDSLHKLAQDRMASLSAELGRYNVAIAEAQSRAAAWRKAGLLP